MIVKKYYLSIHLNTRRGEKLRKKKYIVLTSSRVNGFSALKNRNMIERSKYNDEIEFSCHYIIGENNILQIIPEDEVSFCTRNEFIDYNSISIMLTKNREGKYSKEQIKCLKRLVSYLCRKYGIPKDNVVYEYDITGSRRPEILVDERIYLEDIKKDEE